MEPQSFNLLIAFKFKHAAALLRLTDFTTGHMIPICSRPLSESLVPGFGLRIKRHAGFFAALCTTFCRMFLHPNVTPGGMLIALAFALALAFGAASVLGDAFGVGAAAAA